MKKIVYLISIFFVSFIFVGNVDAATRCQYKWDSPEKITFDVILETEGSSTKFTKITQSPERWREIKISGDIKLNNGECPSVSFYHGSNVGDYVHKDNETCKEKQYADKNCSENIKGKKLSKDDASSANILNKIQLKKTFSSDNSCTYERRSTDTSSTNISLKLEKNNDSIKFTCTSVGDVCKAKGNSTDFLSGSTLNCPSYIYVDSTVNEAGMTLTITSTGGDADTDTSHPIEPKKGNSDISDLSDKSWSNEEGCTALKNGKTIEILRQILNYLQLAAVALLLVLGSLDFAGAIMSDKDDAMKQAGNKFVKRLIAAVIVFLVPVLVNIVLFIADKSESVCGLLG